MGIRWLESTSDGEERDVGKKAASLAALSEYGLNTPRGFVVTAQTFEEFVRQNGLENQIESILNNADRSDLNSLKRTQNRVKNLIMNADVSESVREEIEEAYEKINMSEEVRNAGGEAVDLVGSQRETEFVAVRSSPTGSRFPGAHETFLNINGKSSVIQKMKECWASLYSAEALSIEEDVGTIHSMAVVVQRMVEPDVSGAIFGKNPVATQDKGYVVESLYGLGTGLYDGSSTPDRFVVDKSGNVTAHDVVNKEWRIVRDPTSGKNIKQRVSHDDREARSLDHSQLGQVVDMLQKLESRFGRSVRLDFVFSRNRLYALDLERLDETGGAEESGGGLVRDAHRQESVNDHRDAFLTGRGASGGEAVGAARILYSDTDVERVADQDMLVSVNASERLLPVIPRVSGIVTDKGGLSSNLVSVARMIGTPCIVGTTNATDMLTQEEQITIHGEDGVIREGDTVDRDTPDMSAEPAVQQQFDNGAGDALTATHIKVLGHAQEVQADGAVLSDYAGRQQVLDAANTYRPGRVWARTDDPGLSDQDHIGVLTQHLNHDIQGKGTVLNSFGGVMQSDNLIERGVQFIGLDVDALKTDGDREALMNSIKKIGTETGTACESSLLLRSLDPDIVQVAVESGIDSIAVPPEHVDAARRKVAKAEKRFMLQKLRDL